MSSIVISGDTSGSITLSSPAVAGSNTVTMPAASGVCMVSGNMPAFSAYPTGNQSYSANVATKVNFGTEEYDTNNNFASSRFTPTVAGYYQLNYRISVGAQYGIVQLYKNGSVIAEGNTIQGYAQGFDSGAAGSNLVYANGSTDYFEVYVISNTGTQLINGSISTGITLGTCFQGAMVRSA
jgi:hypothetical protein